MNNASFSASSTNHLDNDNFASIKGPKKISECLILLLTWHETDTHDAGRAYNETYLHSEVSGLQKDPGLKIDRVRQQTPNARSNSAYTHFSITGNNRIKGMNLVNALGAKRNAEPMNWDKYFGLMAVAQ